MTKEIYIDDVSSIGMECAHTFFLCNLYNRLIACRSRDQYFFCIKMHSVIKFLVYHYWVFFRSFFISPFLFKPFFVSCLSLLFLFFLILLFLFKPSIVSPCLALQIALFIQNRNDKTKSKIKFRCELFLSVLWGEILSI